MFKTKRDLFNAILAIVADENCGLNVETRDAITEGIQHEIDLLDRKASTPKKPTAQQVENETFKADILAYLSTEDAPRCIKEIQAGVPSVSEISNQRITHILTAMVNAGVLVKDYVKKTPFYVIAQ